jgi:hypothetical protein
MSRPTMSRTMAASVIGWLRASIVDTVEPSRITVTVSATRRTSLSLWLMMMLVTPCAFSSSIRSSSAWLSASDSAAVGSSRISSRTSLDRALAISTSCCLPTPSLSTSVVGASRRPTLRSSASVRWKVPCQSITPLRAFSLPRKTFSAIDSSGTSASSW